MPHWGAWAGQEMELGDNNYKNDALNFSLSKKKEISFSIFSGSPAWHSMVLSILAGWKQRRLMSPLLNIIPHAWVERNDFRSRA